MRKLYYKDKEVINLQNISNERIKDRRLDGLDCLLFFKYVGDTQSMLLSILDKDFTTKNEDDNKNKEKS